MDNGYVGILVAAADDDLSDAVLQVCTCIFLTDGWSAFLNM